MKEKVSEQLDEIVFAVSQIIFGCDAKMAVHQSLVKAALAHYGITEEFLRPE